MPKPDSRAIFALGEPRFLSLEAYAHSNDHESHISWFASFDETTTENGYRTVIATLHAGNEDATATVTLGGHFYWGSGAAQPKTRESLADLITYSIALETMYDMARQQALSLLAVAELSIEIPLVSPDAEVRELRDRSEQSGDSDSKDEESA